MVCFSKVLRFIRVQRRRKSRDVATPILWFQDTQDKTSGARLPGLEKRPISQKLKARQKPKQQEEKTLSYYSQPLPLARELVYPQAEKTSRYRLMQQIKIQRESALQQIYLGLPGRSIKYAEHTTLLQPSIGCQQLTPTFTVDRPACEIFSVLNGVHSLDTQERKLPVLKQPGFHPYGTDDILDDASKLDHQDPIQKTTIHPPKRMRTLSKEHVVKQLMDLSISRT
ncbi:hypothetical protein EDD86DRAFT_20126 [Gorgonomyces haynaldii]|nr:hypothetical protein EDD86DRAFT_20126 [Gorgonomyces haynaldii]